MKLIITLSLIVLFLYSCKCGLDVKIGEFKLSEASFQFIPYSGIETLVFVDNNGVNHILKSKVGRNLNDTRMFVRTICDEGTFDEQRQYYEIQSEQIAYFDSLDNLIFYVELKTQFEDAEDLDSIAIYDVLMVNTAIKGGFIGRIEIITKERQNQVSSFHRNEFLNQSDFLGDTIIYGRQFVDVFKSTTDEGKSIFYNTEKGVLAFKMTEEDYWVLKS